MSKLYIIHELAAEQLEATAQFLSRELSVVVGLCHCDNIASLAKDSMTLILHLKLDHEIEMHKAISSQLDKLELQQLNPYDLLAEIADDKYRYYEYMRAAETPQAASIKLSRGSYSDDEINNLIFEFAANHSDTGIVMKPVHGTEKIDFFMMLEMDLLNLACQHAQKVLSYDDLLLQQYISSDAEYRALYLMGKFYFRSEFPANYQSQLQAMLEALPLAPKVIAFDILDQGGVLIPLEVNIRPAGMHRCVYHIV